MEPLGASVVQKDVIVVRSKVLQECWKTFSHTEIEGTYDNVRVLDTFSQHISSIFSSLRFQCVLSFPYQTEALLSKSVTN